MQMRFAHGYSCAAVTQLGPALKELSGEADQLSRILASIAIKTKVRVRTGYAVFAFCIAF
jgi:hypothetical protein